MLTRWRAVRRQLAVLVIVPLALAAGVAGASPAAAGAATYVDTVGDNYGAVGGSRAGDILAYTVDLGGAALTVSVRTAATVADPLPALVAPAAGANSARIGIATTADLGSPYFTWSKYEANTSDDGGWVIDDPYSGQVYCRVGQLTDGPDVIVLTVPLGCIGSPSHVGITVMLGVNQGRDYAPYFEDPGAPGASSGADVAPADVPRVAVYRFWSPFYGNAHFFTTDWDEARRLSGDPYERFRWRFEGFAFSALPANGVLCDEGLPMYRFWSPVFSSHFYTLDAGEKGHIVAADHNWQYEGVAFCAYADDQPGTVPLYRFWSPIFGKHFFTADQAEADHIRAVDHNWQYEGIAAYVFQEA